ncbi:cell division ATP-binding protein FtsE [Natranaerobius thermophilus]|uniref:ABC transporter related n=1 Tax=Natranaerobius thermophilus (strain ATCC BAA-1301 / DSM 18059 / JW/NM-WN-LF) TaxID=457570 RepID=B2A5H5_NATTJ|nr:ATP-binding cassette domain-containing protein [Natranaerobius thermophilus]ACB85330.1 ABC transporter related [Natranaerobius thermophilus JW/NM-WN-LF]
MIDISNLSLEYNHTKTMALKNIDFYLTKGEMAFLVGESGAGKTSLINIIMGNIKPTSGRATVNGISLTNRGINKVQKVSLRRQIGPIFQDFKLFKGRSVLENVLIGLRVLGPITEEDKHHVIQLLNQVGLQDMINHKIDHLSFGERQRVAITRAVARKPEIILADEPTGNLDQETAFNILKLLASFKSNNTTILITTHATHLLKYFQGRVITLKSGQVSSDDYLEKEESR